MDFLFSELYINALRDLCWRIDLSFHLRQPVVPVVHAAARALTVRTLLVLHIRGTITPPVRNHRPVLTKAS
jgi:hypothetical protein